MVQIDQLVLLRTDPEGFGMLERMNAVPGLHAFDQVDLSLVFRGVDLVDAGLVQRYGSSEARMPMSPMRGGSGSASQSQSTERLFITLM